MKHPETVKAFTTTLQKLGIDLYGHVYPNIPKAIASLAQRKFFLGKDETILYVNFNEKENEGIVSTDCRFLRKRKYTERPYFRNWAEITVEYGDNNVFSLLFHEIDGNRNFGDIRPYEFEPPYSSLSDIPNMVKDGVEDYLKSKWWGRLIAGEAIRRREEKEIEENSKIGRMKAKRLYELFSKMIDSQKG